MVAISLYCGVFWTEIVREKRKELKIKRRKKRQKKTQKERKRCARMKERLYDEGVEEADGSALFVIYKQGRSRTFITLSHWKRGAVHRIIHCAKMQIQILHHDLIFLLHSSASASVVSLVPSLAGSYSFAILFFFLYFLRHLTSFFVLLPFSLSSAPMVICTLPLTSS